MEKIKRKVIISEIEKGIEICDDPSLAYDVVIQIANKYNIELESIARIVKREPILFEKVLIAAQLNNAIKRG